MPRQTQTQMTQRKQVTDQETFDYSVPNLGIVARPTDPFIQPQAPDTSVLDTLRILTGAVEGYTAIQEGQARKNQMKAQADAAQDYITDPNNPDASSGKPKSFLNQGWGYDEAYNISFGEATGIDFKNEYLQKLKENNYFVDSQNPEADRQKLWNDLYTKHFGNQLNNTPFMFGGSSNIKTAQIQGTLDINNAVFKKAKGEYLTAQLKILTDVAAQNATATTQNPTMVRQNLDTNYSTNVQPTNMMSQDEYTINTIDAFGANALNIINEKIVNPDGTITYRYSTAEAIQILYKQLNVLDAPGADGTTWSMVRDENGNFKYKSRVDYWRNAAIQAIELREKENDKGLRERSEATFMKLDGQIFSGQDITAMVNAEYEAGNLTYQDATNLLDRNRMGKSQDWDIIEDDNTVLKLKEGIYAGNMLKSDRQIMDAWYSGKINRKTAEELLGLRNQVNISLTNKDNPSATSAYKQENKYVIDSIDAYFASTSPVSTIKTRSAHDIQTLKVRAQQELYIRVMVNKENPFEVAADLVNRYTTGSRDYLPGLRYHTWKDIQAAIQSGKLTPEEAEYEIALYREHLKLTQSNKK